ncbi:hypothetical protein AAHZ94_23445 [Streptomyces sp. HSW2009]|uniref:hypothetical protein n=1 Tax=Streptomyces sp. HSW2009 TaxID=3142890 RepID=UPI0032F05A2B
MRTHRRTVPGDRREEAGRPGAPRPAVEQRPAGGRGLLALQGAVGNDAVLRMLHHPEQPTVQRTHFEPGDQVTAHPGFSVTLDAALGGTAIGTFSSQTTAQSRSDHAEDQLIDELESALLFVGGGSAATTSALAAGQTDPATGLTTHQLVISNLTASPCSHRQGTSTKVDKADGCAERLIDLATNGIATHRFQISITADRLYKPQVEGALERSQRAVDDMRAAGIAVRVG